MVIIIGILVLLFLVLIAWSWNSLGDIDKNKKNINIIVGVIVIYLFTLIIYSISKNGITYENKEAMKTIRNVFVFLFTTVNGYLILPYVFKKMNQVKSQEIEKEKFKKSIVITGIIMIILTIFEINYFSNIQQQIVSNQVKNQIENKE